MRTFQAVFLLGATFYWVGCSSEKPETFEAPIRPAKLITVTAESEIQTLNFPAVIEASSSVDVSFQVGGLVQKLPVKSGQQLEEGDLIAQLDLRDFENAVAKAQAQYDNAESEFQRAERLLAEQATSRQNYEQLKSQRDISRASLEAANKQLDDATLTSPFAGIIATLHADKFENIAANEKVVTLQTTGTAQATVEVPATVVASSKRYETEERVVILDAAPNTRIPAVLGSVSTEADPTTQTFEVKFDFAPPEDLVILPGMTGTLQSRSRAVVTGDSQVMVSVPVSAILSDGDARYVWVVDESKMTVSRRDIVVAPTVGEALPVLEGLEPGEVIVGAGASYLHEGASIRRYEP